MNKFVVIVFSLLIPTLIACQPVTKKMEGEPVKVSLPGYDDMCKREPNPALCKGD